MLVITGITGALTFGASLRRVLDEPRARGMSWDVEATDPDGKTILADPDVASATLAVTQTITINDATVEARGLKTVRGEPPAMFIEGRAPSAIDEVALGRKTRRALHVGTGDVVHAAGPGGSVRSARRRHRRVLGDVRRSGARRRRSAHVRRHSTGSCGATKAASARPATRSMS